MTVDIDPTTAYTPAEFVALLRQVRAGSGLTYRMIERRAADAGATLPASTLATMLSRQTLPRQEPVLALLRACGATEEQVAAWTAVRRELAITQGARPRPAPSEPDPPPRHRGRTIGVLAAVLAAVITVGLVRSAPQRAAAHPEEPSEPARITTVTGTPVAPAAGPVRIRSVHSGLCLTERPLADTGELFQAGCQVNFPDRVAVPQGNGLYRFTTAHPRFGPGCLGVYGGYLTAGTPLADEGCQWRNEAELFRLEPVTTPLPGFRLRPLHTGLCAGVTAASRAEWVTVRQVPCDPADPGQVFVFDQGS